MDREAIERRDLAVGRRGCDQTAVDEHLPPGGASPDDVPHFEPADPQALLDGAYERAER